MRYVLNRDIRYMSLAVQGHKLKLRQNLHRFRDTLLKLLNDRMLEYKKLTERVA
jgi:hypothetical protein